MRVLLVHCFYRSSAPSGEDSVYKNEKKLLEDNGYEVITYEKYNDEIAGGLKHKILAGVEFIWSRKAFAELTALIKAQKPDVAHFHNIFPQISTSAHAACQQLGVPVVQTLHNFRYICPAGLLQRNNKPCEKCIEGSLISSLIHKCYRHSLVATAPMAAMIAFNRYAGNFANNVDRYIALTEFAKSRFVAAGFNAEKISVKPNFIADVGSADDILGDYVVYVGRLTQEKGVLTLIEACKKLRHIPIKIVGDGELRARLESVCIQNDLNVEFLGIQPKEQVIQLIKNSRFLVLPSECYEGFPVTIAEAYACGKPVLGSKIGSLNELIVEDVTGKKFLFGSTESLANSLNEMWKNTAQLSSMAKNARGAFEKKYNPDINVIMLNDIYSGVIDSARNKIAN